MLYSQTQIKLAQIIHELQGVGLWSANAPSDKAMASIAPFACDLMSFEQWLQFIFIPRMQALIDAGQPLPSQIAIAPMAEHVWSEQATLAPLIGVLNELDIELLCTTAGSPYYNPHIQRPALFPPSDGYLPPEDPLHGVARQIAATAQLKQAFPEFYVVGSAYSYLQEWLPNVGQEVLNTGKADSIGFGRMVLSYPDMPADILSGQGLKRGKICRTFSDCTTAPRNGMISGCFPLDPFYKVMPEYDQLKSLKGE